MNYFKTLKTEFKNTAFKDKKEDKKTAIEMAYADMSRHQYGHKAEIKEHCVKWLLDKVFNDDLKIDDFSTWHKNTCVDLIKKMDEKKANFGTVGRAQKVINMAIKYLSCISTQYDDILKDCHMTLDGFTLSWYASCVAGEKCEIKWSKIATYEEYISIQDKIRIFLSENNDFSIKIDGTESPKIELPASPYEAEFIIWEGKIAEGKYNKLINALSAYKQTGRAKDNWIIGTVFDDFLKDYCKKL